MVRAGTHEQVISPCSFAPCRVAQRSGTAHSLPDIGISCRRYAAPGNPMGAFLWVSLALSTARFLSCLRHLSFRTFTMTRLRGPRHNVHTQKSLAPLGNSCIYYPKKLDHHSFQAAQQMPNWVTNKVGCSTPHFEGFSQLARLSFQRGSNYCSITHFKRPAAVRAYSLMKELFKAVLKNSCGALFHVVAGCIVAIFPPFRWGYCFARPKRPGYHAVPPLISRGAQL